MAGAASSGPSWRRQRAAMHCATGAAGRTHEGRLAAAGSLWENLVVFQRLAKLHRSPKAEVWQRRAVRVAAFALRLSGALASDRDLPYGAVHAKMAVWIGELLNAAVRGHPDPVFCKPRGGRHKAPHVQTAERLAVEYVALARSGVVDDPHPVRTVREMYGVHEATWRRWRDSHRPSGGLARAIAERRSDPREVLAWWGSLHRTGR